jgi:A/G-specific adenine glycosylase
LDNDLNLESLPAIERIILFRSLLLEWAPSGFRPFAWRFTLDPYCILMAETLLHRTQAKQVEPVYLRFIDTFPDIQALHSADREDLRGLLYPLGLFWRTELIKLLADELIDKFGGEIPEDKAALLSLPGVGDYIASSVRCFAFGQPDAIIDTNMMRVITRVFGIPFKDSLRRNRAFRALASRLVDPLKPVVYNFAILDLANQICTPRSPDCPACPLLNICMYGQELMKNNPGPDSPGNDTREIRG